MSHERQSPGAGAVEFKYGTSAWPQKLWYGLMAASIADSDGSQGVSRRRRQAAWQGLTPPKCLARLMGWMAGQAGMFRALSAAVG